MNIMLTPPRYGESVTSFSVEQAAVLRAFSFNQLEAYFE